MEGDICYRSKKFNVVRVSRTDAGATHVHEIVAHPGAAVILPLLEDGRVVLIRNRRVAADQELLELPAGTLDPQETPIEAARRELEEETGYRAGRLTPLTHFYSSPGICNEVLYAFSARDLTPGPQHLDPAERITLAIMSFDESVQAIGAQRIIDAKSIATLLFYGRFGAGD